MKFSSEKNIPFFSFLFFFFLFSFIYGITVAQYKVWPYEELFQIKRALISLYKTKRIVPENQINKRPDYAKNTRIFKSALGSMKSGYYAIMGYNDKTGKDNIWLLDHEGNEKHRWNLDYQSVVPDSAEGEHGGSHGMLILNDGSVLVAYDLGKAMARFDRCSHPVWVKPGHIHHSFDLAEDGTVWTWEGIGSAYAQEQLLVNFNVETGETISSISLIDDIIKKYDQSALEFSIPKHFIFKKFDENFIRPNDDIFHPNDLEILTSEKAPFFPKFQAGDFLVSLKRLNLVAVIDFQTKKIKWAMSRPWHHQHDPDFNENGTITVYNNNSGFQESSIIEVNPDTNQFSNRFSDGNVRFYSEYMGKHQKLPNGNTLIVSPLEGRVIEVDRNGDVIFEFNNMVTNELNAIVQNAIWLPENFFTQAPQCKAAQ